MKRRKTSHESSEDISTLAYHQLIMQLNGSSQDSPVLNLSGLHDIVQYVTCPRLLIFLLTTSGQSIPLFLRTYSVMKEHNSNYLRPLAKLLAQARGVCGATRPVLSTGNSSAVSCVTEQLLRIEVKKSTGTRAIVAMTGRRLSPLCSRLQKKPNSRIRQDHEC